VLRDERRRCYAKAVGLNEDGVPKKFVSWLWYWLPPLILMAVIFYVSSRSSLPQAQGEWLDAVIKKISHIGEYTLLFLLLVRAWKWTLDTRWAGQSCPATLQRARSAAPPRTRDAVAIAENAGWSTDPAQNAGWSTDPAQNAGWSTDPAQNAGWSTDSMERALWAALLTTAAYGISDEVHQAFVPRRHSNWYDVVIDVAVPLLLCLLWYGRRGLRRPRHPDLAE
jgi:VanZ family protein